MVMFVLGWGFLGVFWVCVCVVVEEGCGFVFCCWGEQSCWDVAFNVIVYQL